HTGAQQDAAASAGVAVSAAMASAPAVPAAMDGAGVDGAARAAAGTTHHSGVGAGVDQAERAAGEAQQVPAQQVLGQPPLLFEVGWEFCWQLGGIYTVLRTKARAMIETWGDRYYLVGPYNPATAAVEFEETPTDGFIRQALDRLRSQGVACHHGRWLVPGRPRVILLDYRARYQSLDTDKYLLWKDHGIPTQGDDGEVNDVVAFGFTAANFFRVLREVVTDRPIVAHFHEWMGGLAVPRIAHQGTDISTVFTTHATLLGRYL